MPPDHGPVRAIDVVWFNYPTYLVSILAITCGVALLVLLDLPDPIRLVVVLGVALAAWWLIASFAVSVWVFDLSGVTRWRWLPAHFGQPITGWLNVTTGFDDSTSALRSAFPETNGIAVDVFDPDAPHDGSLRRARKSRPPTGVAVRPGAPLPVESESVDAVFMLMAVHELRDARARATLFADAARVLRPKAPLVLVEHLRNPINAVAFGPGVFHFLGRQVWLDDARAAGLRLASERRLTPFAHALTFAKAAAGG